MTRYAAQFCSPLSTQSTFEDLAVDFEGTTASGAERFYRRTLDKLRLKLLESGLVHTVTLKQTECRKRNKKIAAAVYLYQADNDGEWGEIRFDFGKSGHNYPQSMTFTQNRPS